MMTDIPKRNPDEDVAAIMACLAVLEKYEADKPCECKDFVCPQHLLGRVYRDLRAFASFLAE